MTDARDPIRGDLDLDFARPSAGAAERLTP